MATPFASVAELTTRRVLLEGANLIFTESEIFTYYHIRAFPKYVQKVW